MRVLIPHVHAFFRLLLVNSFITIFNFFWHIFSYWTYFVGGQQRQSSVLSPFLGLSTFYLMGWNYLQSMFLIQSRDYYYICIDHQCDFCGRISKNVINITFKWWHHYISMWLRWYFYLGYLKWYVLQLGIILLFSTRFYHIWSLLAFLSAAYTFSFITYFWSPGLLLFGLTSRFHFEWFASDWSSAALKYRVFHKTC